MSFFDFFSYPLTYTVSSLNFGIYRFLFFLFFTIWQIYNFSDLRFLVKEIDAAETKKTKKTFLGIKNENVLYFSVLFSFLSCIGFLGNLSILFFAISFVFVIEKIRIFIATTGDVVLKACLLFLFLSPCSFSFSIDSFIFTGNFINKEILIVPGTFVLLIQLMIILMYAYASFAKINDPTWLDGEALYAATKSPIYGKRNFLSKLFDSKFLLLFTSKIIMSYQFFAILFLSLSDTKEAYALIGVAIHLGMSLTMHLGYFPHIMILALLSFLI